MGLGGGMPASIPPQSNPHSSFKIHPNAEFSSPLFASLSSVNQIETMNISFHLLNFLLLFTFSHFLASSKFLKGRLFFEMEPCPSPIVQILKSESNENGIISSSQNPIVDPPAGSFQIEVPWKQNGNLTIEAECAPKKEGEMSKKSTYNLELDKIEWDGANELLLFNDVHILAFTYPSENIGIA